MILARKIQVHARSVQGDFLLDSEINMLYSFSALGQVEAKV